jgi:argininosuccinate lyase
MKEIEDRMMKMESKFEDRMMKMENKFEDIMTRVENSIVVNMGEVGNRIVENVCEVVTSITMYMQRRVDQIIESEKDKFKVISVPIHGHIQTLTNKVRFDKDETFETQIKHQSN